MKPLLSKFTLRTYVLQTTTALLLAVSLSLYFISQNSLQATEQRLQQLDSAENKLNHLKRNLSNYKTLLASTPWPANSELKQEPLNVSVSLGQRQLDQLDSIIKSNYERDSLFILESFKLKEVRSEKSGLSELEMHLLGEKRIILY